MNNLENLITDYQPAEQAVTLVRNSKIVLLAGISGAGKDTIKKRLLQKPIFCDIVSHTTRLPRLNNNRPEVDGVDYHFIDLETAERMLKNHEFIEAKFVHGTVYGTSVAELQAAHSQNRIAITDIDVQGMAEYKQLSEKSISIFIVPPDYTTWLMRLRSRYTTEAEFQKEWPKRRASSIKELTHALEVSYYHVIVNDDLDRAERVVCEIIERGETFSVKDDEARLKASQLLSELKSNS